MAAERPNILLITTDQQRFDTIAALGNRSIYTPHLDWLAQTGIAFTRCYSDCPICMPARVTLMTGLAACRHGLTGNENTKTPLAEHDTLPGLLTRSGYQTKSCGKLHFHPMRANYGIESAELPMDYFTEMRRLGKPHSRMHGVGENEVTPVLSSLEERDTLIHWTVDRSLNFLETRDPTRPFFLWTSFAKPHPPFDPLLSYWELYRDIPMDEPALGDWTQGEGAGGFFPPTFMQPHTAFTLSPRQQQAMKRAYYASITQIDYNLGLLLARMREMNLLENTWILFTSDHGDMLGDHGMIAKSVFFEGSAHVPMILKPPAAFGEHSPVMRPGRCDLPVTLADVFPTLLARCAVEHGPVDGRDLLEILETGEERTLYGTCQDRYYMILEGPWKYTWAALGGKELLFDLSKDPYEQHDLAADPACASIREKLARKLASSMEAHGDSCARNGALTPRGEAPRHGQEPLFPGLNTTLFPRDTFH